jgi:HKD family nuclease
MLTDVELFIFPYDALDGSRSLLHLLIEELRNDDWTHFHAAVAFAKTSGNFPDLLDALVSFAAKGNRIDLTFGADRFSGESKGSDYDAIEEVLSELNQQATANVYLYHEVGRTFHPKVYLFSNTDLQRALVFIGSANWSEGGFGQNVEANVLLRLDLSKADHKACFDKIRIHFDQHWTGQ